MMVIFRWISGELAWMVDEVGQIIISKLVF